LFFETLKPLSRNIYSRGECISNEIEEVLAPELQTNQTSLPEYAIKVEKVRLAVKLGVEFESIAEGHNGSYFGLDRFGKKMVVFKPFDEEGASENSPKTISKIERILKRIFPKVSPNGNINRDQCYLNEVGASAVDAFISLNVVPITKLETFTSNAFSGDTKEKLGSCQLFVEGTKSGERAFRIPSYLSHFLKKVYLRVFEGKLSNVLDQDRFEKMVILDFLIGNQDRHLKNLLVEGKSAVAIDNGLSFPNKKPDNIFSLRHQYYWRHLPQAKKTFSEDSKGRLDKIKTQDERQKLFQLLQDTMKDGETCGFNEEQKREMVERMEMLEAVIEQGKPISYLGEIRTQEDFDRVRKELNL